MGMFISIFTSQKQRAVSSEIEILVLFHEAAKRCMGDPETGVVPERVTLSFNSSNYTSNHEMRLPRIEVSYRISHAPT
jgi:hypothetical protein